MTFKFRPVLTVFALIGIVILIALGTWQLQRLEWKLGLIEKVETRIAGAPQPLGQVYDRWKSGEDTEYQPVVIVGRFLHDREVHVFGTYEAAPGWYVMTPAEMADGQLVYVNRGFVPADFKAPASRPAGQVAGELRITGLMRGPEQRVGLSAMFQPVDNPEQNEWYTRDAARFSAHAGFEALPVIVDSFGEESANNLPRGGTTRIEFSNNHLSYAFTWYGLALTLLVVYGVFSLQRRK